MPIVGSLLVSLVCCVHPAELKARATQHVIQEFERVGRSAPNADPNLDRAAIALAQKALDTSAAEAAEASMVSEAIADAEGYDPGARATIVRASPTDHALQSFLARTDFNQEPATLMGVAVAVDGERAAIVALIVQRKAELKHFPRSASKGTSKELCGQLVAPLESASVYVTRPSGNVDPIPLTVDRGTTFCARISFRDEGRYSVEVIGHGHHGSEVAALFPVSAGAKERSEQPIRLKEPTTAPEAQRAILKRINSVRSVYGVSPVELDLTLNSVAQMYSERMGREHFFAHIAPDGSDLQARLRKAGYTYQAAAENLGLADGPIAAHLSLERSPGHRKNLIEGSFTRIGVGVAFVTRGGRPQVFVTEVFAKPLSPLPMVHGRPEGTASDPQPAPLPLGGNSPSPRQFEMAPRKPAAVSRTLRSPSEEVP